MHDIYTVIPRWDYCFVRFLEEGIDGRFVCSSLSPQVFYPFAILIAYQLFRSLYFFLKRDVSSVEILRLNTEEFWRARFVFRFYFVRPLSFLFYIRSPSIAPPPFSVYQYELFEEAFLIYTKCGKKAEGEEKTALYVSAAEVC